MPRTFKPGDFCEDNVENVEEIHSLVILNNERTLEFKGEGEINFVDVVSGEEGMTMVVSFYDGRDSREKIAFKTFNIQEQVCRIRGIPNTTESVAYRTGPKGWMDSTVLPI